MNGEEGIGPRIYDRRRIDPKLINLDEVFFRLTTTKDKWPLEESLDRAGLLAPPFLLPTDNRFNVVCGFRRVAACRALGWKTLPAFVLPAQTDRLKCAAIAITDNALQRRLNLVEQARAVAILTEILPETELGHWARNLGLPAHRKILLKLRRLSTLPEPILAGVVDGLYNLPTALIFTEMRLSDQLAVARLFEVLRPSTNIQREMLSLIQEIAARDGATITDLLAMPEVIRIAFDLEIDRNRRVQQVRQILQRMRFPRMAADLDRFHRVAAELNLGDKVHIAHPPNFEGDTFAMTIRFKNRDDLREAQTRIQTALNQDFFDALFPLNRPSGRS
jgi:ParB family chromosome partitioning protein